MNNTLEGVNNRITEAEDRYMTWRTEWWKSLSQNKEWKDMKTDSETSGTLNAPTFALKGSQKEKRERTWENIWKDNRWKIPEHEKGNSQPSPRSTESSRKDKLKEEHIVIKQTKIKDRGKILKATREKGQITYKGSPIKISTDLSTETLQAWREWHDIFKVIKGKNLQPRVLYPATLSLDLMEKSKPFQTSKSWENSAQPN